MAYISLERIVQHVAENYNYSTEDVISKKQEPVDLVEVRKIAVYLCWKLSNESVKDIGNLFSRDHSTIIYYMRTISDKCQRDEDFRRQMQENMDRIESLCKFKNKNE